MASHDNIDGRSKVYVMSLPKPLPKDSDGSLKDVPRTGPLLIPHHTP
jgi:hypothetical protein